MLPKPFYIPGNLGDFESRIAGSFSIHFYVLWGPVSQNLAKISKYYI